jgi:hypothetical protein
MTWLTVAEYLCPQWPRLCSVCRNHNLIIFSFMTHHRIFNKCNTTGATNWAGTAYPFGVHEFILVFSGARVIQPLVFYVVFCISSFVLFLLAIVLPVLLRLMASDYPFGIFKLFHVKSQTIPFEPIWCRWKTNLLLKTSFNNKRIQH